MNPNNS